MKLVVLAPHFEPDTAPTGRVITRIVGELVARGHEVHVVTALPWYRDHAVAAGWAVPIGRREHTAWGTIARLNPFPGGDKRNLVRRALGFAGFSVRQGKRFELEIAGEITEDVLAQVREAATTLLSNPVIEDVVGVHVVEG